MNELKDEVDLTTESRGGDAQWEKRCVLPFLTPQIFLCSTYFLCPIHLLGSLGIMEAYDSGMGEKAKRREARDGNISNS